MVYVRLAQAWVDQRGKPHRAGELVEVDAATLAGLEADGVVDEPTPVFNGGVRGGDEGKPDRPGPQSGWVGPSSDPSTA